MNYSNEETAVKQTKSEKYRLFKTLLKNQSLLDSEYSQKIKLKQLNPLKIRVRLDKFRTTSPQRKTTNLIGKSMMNNTYRAEFTTLEFNPLINSFHALEKLTNYRKIFLTIPDTLHVNKDRDALFLYTNSKGTICSDKSISISKLKAPLNSYFQKDNSKSTEKLPRYILKMFDDESNSNYCRFYEDADRLITDCNKLHGTYEYEIQTFIPYSKKRPEILRCVVRDVPSNTLAKCFQVIIYQLLADNKDIKDGETRQKENHFKRKGNPLYTLFIDDFDKHIHVMNKIGYSFVASSGALYLNKIKPEKYKSLEDRCIELKKMFDTYYFEPKHYTVTEMVIDFIQNTSNQFVMLQIKDYQCTPIKYSNKTKPVQSTEKDQGNANTTCEGAICKFASQKQIDILENRLIQFGVLPKHWCKIGKYTILGNLINAYREDNLRY